MSGVVVMMMVEAPCAVKRVRSRSSGYVTAVATAPAVAPAMSGTRAFSNGVGDEEEEEADDDSWADVLQSISQESLPAQK